jgi:hypothetical protein
MAHIHQRSYNFPELLAVTRDSRGKLIEVGLRVAYNLSGSVAIGKIEAIPKNCWKEKSTKISTQWSLDFEMHILGENDRITKIKNPNSFVII